MLMKDSLARLVKGQNRDTFKKYIYKLIGKYIVHGFMQQSDDFLLS